ncbi:MAG: RNA chaperone Hfq [Candidatus Sulfotelmatobacter sp.]
MKDMMDSPPARTSDDQDNFANRKLIRPALTRADGNHGNHNSGHANVNHTSGADHRDRTPRHDRPERGQDRGFERGDRGDRGERGGDRGERSMGGGAGRKVPPLEQTNAENFYYQKQMQSRTPMVIVLRDGEEVHGIIEWYDKTCIKVVCENGGPNLMIYKPAIKYMFKEDETPR